MGSAGHLDLDKNLLFGESAVTVHRIQHFEQNVNLIWSLFLLPVSSDSEFHTVKN